MTRIDSRTASAAFGAPLRIDSFADGGVWISDDRVSAFVSGRDGSLRECAYHGRQIVSRNARIFSCETGALHLLYESENRWLPVDMRTARVGTRRVETEPGQGPRCVISADGRAIVLQLTHAGRIRVVLRKQSRVTSVQGERGWSEASIDGSVLRLSCTDRLFLYDWLRREGPYAGDFLIPEHWRRRLFVGPPGSGRARVSDLRPEWRDADPCLYDATVYTTIQCQGGAWDVDELGWQWTSPARADVHMEEIQICFSDTDRAEESGATAGARTVAHAGIHCTPETEGGVAHPVLRLPGYPAVERFFLQAPSIVDACTVRDHGMPRASFGAYYWLWAWDALVAAAEYPRWGALDAMRRVIEFVHRHRDIDGRIPMRWTRDLDALDTPERGALEFLLLNTALEYTRHTHDTDPLREVYPAALLHFHALAASSDTRGLFPGLGFYPDLPERFGRTPRSAVAMEVAAHAGFCLALADAASILGEAHTRDTAAAHAARITDHFRGVFISDRGDEPVFPCDCVDLDTGAVSQSHPVFTLLCLQRPGTEALFGNTRAGLARTLETEFLTRHGIAMLPRGDRNRGSEPATGAWYAHWDLYVIRLWRAEARGGAILRWLDRVEETLARLGYCPEFLDLAPFERGDANAWTRHGAASNINGVTAWYRALLEGVLGLLLDGGRLAVSPDGPLVSGAAVADLAIRGQRWDVETTGSGRVVRLEVDARPVEGLEVADEFFDGQRHSLRIVCDGGRE